MPDPGRDHDDVAGPDRQDQALRAAEADLRLAAGDAQDLVRRAVIVGKRKDAVSP